MNTLALRNWISLIKQKIYCNTDGYVYLKSDEFIPELTPKLIIKIEVIKNQENLKKYEDNADIRRIKEKISFFLNHGCIGYFAVYNKEIVSSCWLCDLNKFHPYLHLNNPIFQGKKNYYIFYANTKNNFRRKGIVSYIYTQILKDIVGKQGKIYALIDTDNIASQKSFLKAGFEKNGWLRHIQIFKWILLSKFIKDKDKI